MIKSISVASLFSEESDNNLFNLYEAESIVLEAPISNPSIEAYMALEEQDKLTVIGLYSNDKLIGFCMLIYVFLTHSSSMAAIVDAFFVHPKHRNFGAGKRLISHAEKIAIDKGAVIITMTSPAGSRLSKVAHSFGYKNTNLIHTKKLA
jgi:GNAT superfamily N-acetyltransferase